MLIIREMLASPHHASTTIDFSHSSFPLDALLECHNTIFTQYISALEPYSTIYGCRKIGDGAGQGDESQVERQEVL